MIETQRRPRIEGRGEKPATQKPAPVNIRRPTRAALEDAVGVLSEERVALSLALTGTTSAPLADMLATIHELCEASRLEPSRNRKLKKDGS